jgi:hypothetical protein
MAELNRRQFLTASGAAVTIGALGSQVVVPLAALADTAPATGPDPALAAEFVRRDGSKLYLGDRQFRFGGPNIFWLGYQGDGRLQQFYYPSHYTVEDGLATAAYMGATVVRAHSLGISTGSPLTIEPALGEFNQTALSYVDYAVAAAARHGLRLIIPFTDNYHYYQGGKHDFTDWFGLTEDAFYTDQRVVDAFVAYVTQLIDHVNVYTGVRLGDDPTIMCWETGNELVNPPLAWTQHIAQTIKSLAPNHLVMDGIYGAIPKTEFAVAEVDLYSHHFNHYPPMSLSRLNSDVTAVAAAGKAYVVGEFGWNSPYGGDPLPDFLAAIEANSDVSGSTYWSLFPHNDSFGFVPHGDGYTLHYPGETPAYQSLVDQLRSHAFRMSGLTVPATPAPVAPEISNVAHTDAGVLVEWRGAAGAAKYLLQRSGAGPNGPWVTVTDSATDLDTPYLDADGSKAHLYRVAGTSTSGKTGPFSAPYRANNTKTLVDNLDDWSLVHSHSDDLVLDSSNPQNAEGDTSRASRHTSQADEIVWHAPGMRSFEMVTYFWPSEKQSHFTVQVSTDANTWTDAANDTVLVGGSGNWVKWTYSLQNLQAVDYVRVVWNNLTGQHFSPQIGTVRIVHGG